MNIYPVKSSKAGVHYCEQFDGASYPKAQESLSPTIGQKRNVSKCVASDVDKMACRLY